MTIVHIAPNAPFNDGWGYQDNLLPKYHAKLGHDVILLVTDMMHAEGTVVHTDERRFTSVDGFEVIRFPYKRYASDMLTTVFSHMDVYETLTERQPDFIFYHGLMSRTIFDVIRYKKQREKAGHPCVVVQDNHLDYNIGTKCSTVRQKMMRAYYRALNRQTQKYVSRVYGVTPWRKTYAEEYYRISPAKTDVLIMGADDEKIRFSRREEIRASLRERFGVGENEFLVMTGGKIDSRKQVIPLLAACKDLKHIKLVVFGNVQDDVKDAFHALADTSDTIQYIGWVAADAVYDLFFAADLVVFPGQHSVLWEQACAAKAPCVFLQWEGMTHVDAGGNAAFMPDASVDTIRQTLEALHFTERYHAMKQAALSDLTDVFLYSEIAKKSLEMWNER